MKIASFVILALAGAASATGLSAGPAPVAARAADGVAMPVAKRVAPRRLDANSASKRDCIPTDCRCNGIPGDFCGDESINTSCWNTNVYECYPGGYACNAGFDYSCAACHSTSC